MIEFRENDCFRSQLGIVNLTLDEIAAMQPEGTEFRIFKTASESSDYMFGAFQFRDVYRPLLFVHPVRQMQMEGSV